MIGTYPRLLLRALLLKLAKLKHAFCTRLRLPSKIHVEELTGTELTRARAVEPRILYATSFQNAC